MSAILVIWIGFGQAQTMAVTRFPSIDECVAAKVAIEAAYNGGMFSTIDPDDVRCLPVPAKTERNDG